MGIDVYLRWDGMTDAERNAQYTGFEVSERAGGLGYLREAYHGSPYATKVLVPEAFNDECDEVTGESIPTSYIAEVLEARLDAAVETAERRARTIYKEPVDDHSMVNALKAFVALARRLQDEGKKFHVDVSW